MGGFMIHNAVIEALTQRKSIRKYTDEKPSDEILKAIVRAAQQAPFAAQMCSLLLSRKYLYNPLSFLDATKSSYILCRYHQYIDK